MLGGSSLGIGVTLFLRDQFSGTAARVRASAKQTEAEFLRMQQNQLRQQSMMYAGLAVGGVMALRGMGRMVKKAAEFSYEMEFVKSITAATATEQGRLSGIAKRLGRETMFYPQAIAEGMRFMAMAGMSAAEVEKNIQGAVTLAGATKSELGGKGGAADIMTNVMKQYQIGFKYTNDVADMLSYAVTRANTNLFDLGDALKYSGATAMDLNISLGESTSMVMALGNAGMQGSMAGVAMENSMRYLARAFSSFGSGPSQRALAELRLTVEDVTDSAGNLLTMTEVIKKVGDSLQFRFGGMENVETQAILQSIFGVRGKRAGSLLIRNFQEFDRFTSEIATKSKGHAGRIMADMMSTLQGHMYKMGSAWQAMWVSFTEKVAPTLIVIMKGLIKTLAFFEKVFDKKILGGFLATGIAGFLVWKTAVCAYRAVAMGLKAVHIGAKISALNMVSSTVAGYSQMTAAAGVYAAASTAAAVTTRAQMVGLIGTARAGGMKGVTLNAAGRMVAKSRTGMRAFVSGKQAGAIMAGTAGVVGGRVVARGATRMLLGRIVGIFGGPLGMALAFVLPGLIGAVVSAVRNSKQSTDANTKQLQEANAAKLRAEMQYSRVGHVLQFQDLKTPELTMIGQSVVGQQQRNLSTDTLGRLTQQLEKLLESKQVQPINIYIDNELAIQKIFERNMADSLSVLQ